MSAFDESTEAQEAGEIVEDMEQQFKSVKVASEDSETAELTASTFAAKMLRKAVFFLAMRKNQLRELVVRLRSSKKYISEDERDLLKFALVHMQKYSSIDTSMEVYALTASSRHQIERPIREKVALWVELLLNSEQLSDVCPSNDYERFDSLVEDVGVTAKCWTDMRTIGVVMCHVLHRRRMIELSGTKV